MKTNYFLIIGVVVLLGLGGYLVSKHYTSSSIRPDTGSTLLTYSNATYGLSFTYPSTYVLNETDVAGNNGEAHHSIVLLVKKDVPLPVNGEGPTSITIDLYQNSNKSYTNETWIRTSAYSNFKLGEGILATTTVGGLSALSYRWNGLYNGTTIVVAKPSWMYAFSVTYFEMGDDVVQDFVKVRDSVHFLN